MHSRFLAAIPVILLNSCQPGGTPICTGPGSEDLTFIETGGRRLLFTGTAPRANRHPTTADQSHIEAFDLDRPGKEFAVWETRPMITDGKVEGFLPVGLHAMHGPAPQSHGLLYVVSAGWPLKSGGRVMAFRIGQNSLTEDASLTTPFSKLLATANGITVARDGTIYVSNFGLLPSCDRPQCGKLDIPDDEKPPTNTILRFKPGSKDGCGEWEIVAHGFGGANGLALTPDEKYLLVCSYHGKCIHAFERAPDTGDLTGPPIPVQKLGFHPDNLKALGNNEYSVGGQLSTIGAGAQLLFKLPTGCGGGERFRWKAGEKAKQLTDYTPSLRTDCQSPSTALPVGNKLYAGHIQSPGVRAYDLPRE